MVPTSQVVDPCDTPPFTLTGIVNSNEGERGGSSCFYSTPRVSSPKYGGSGDTVEEGRILGRSDRDRPGLSVAGAITGRRPRISPSLIPVLRLHSYPRATDRESG